jgi:glycine/D-amino acid oxidase-like deaminating enzyme
MNVSRSLNSNKITMVLRRVTLQDQEGHPLPGMIYNQPPQPPHANSDQILPVPNPIVSYWLTQPHKHANLRSTATLPSTCDIAIIGSGMAGVLTAYHILQNSAPASLPSVLLFDARSLCSGATGRNGGHAKVKTATLTSLPGDRARNAMQSYVFGVMRELKAIIDAEDGLGEECEFEMRRSFDVFQNEKDVAEVKGVYDAARKKGEKWTESVSWIPRGMVEQVTSIRGSLGAFSSPAVSLWPYKFVTGLLGRLVERYPERLNVQMNTAVTGVESVGNVLSTSRGEVKAGKVVFATNGWTAGLLQEFKDTITPIKGMASHHKPERAIHPYLGSTYNIHFAPTATGQSTGVDYLNPRPDGGIVVGGGGWLYKEKKECWWGEFDDSVHFPEAVEAHWTKYMQDTFLGWENSKAVADMVWTGIMGYTGDGQPHIGRVPSAKGEKLKSQWMLAGFNGGGMAIIGTAAKAVAKMIIDDLEFEDVKEEFGLLDGFGTCLDRLKKGKEDKKSHA